MSKSDSEQYAVVGYTNKGKHHRHDEENSLETDLSFDFSRIRLVSDGETEPSEAELPADDELISPQVEKKYAPDACLFVASLVSSRTEKQLQESVVAHFSKWGELENVKVLKDSMNRPYSFVQFRDVESAEQALTEAHNTLVDGRHIRVEKARVNRKLYVTRISTGLTEEELKEALWTHGPLDHFRMMRNAATGDAKGSCFVQYRFREDAIKAFMYIKNQGRWEVEWASTQEKVPRSYDFNSVFVGQLCPSQVTREALEARFQAYGVIDSLSLINKPTADNAFAFIKYSSQESCVRAIEGEDGIFWHDRPMRVQFKEAGPKPRIKARRPVYPYPFYSYPGRPIKGGGEEGKNPVWFAQYPIYQNPDGSYAQAPGYYIVGPQSYPGTTVPSPQSVYSRSSPAGYIQPPMAPVEQ